MANSLKSALIAAGITLSSVLEPGKRDVEANLRHEQLKESEFAQTMRRLLAQEYVFTRPKWVGKPRLTIQQMMQRDVFSKVHGTPEGDLTPKVNQRELARLEKEIPQMPITSVRYDDNLNPTFTLRDGNKKNLEDL